MNPNHITIAMHHFLLALIHSITECRQARDPLSIDVHFYQAFGQCSAALSLQAIDHGQHMRLTNMALNAATLRSRELLKGLPPHSLSDASTPLENAA